MKARQKDYEIICGESHATLKGVLRLGAVERYRGVFGPINECMRHAPGEFIIDMADVAFMDSSGIRGLAGSVLEARSTNIPLVLVCNTHIPWQKKTLQSLQSMHGNLTVRFRDE